MDKASTLQELIANGQITVFRRSTSWEKAFDLYNKEHKTSLRPSCGSCFRMVSDWLKK